MTVLVYTVCLTAFFAPAVITVGIALTIEDD